MKILFGFLRLSCTIFGIVTLIPVLMLGFELTNFIAGLFLLLMGVFSNRKLKSIRKKEQQLEEEKKKEAKFQNEIETERRKIIEKEQKKKQDIERKKKLEAEEKRKAEQLRLENNSYYYEIEINNKKVVKGPFTKEEINGLLSKNEISLLTKVKFGLHKKTFKQLKNFPEFISGFEDFL